jgi:hypothetical protein
MSTRRDVARELAVLLRAPEPGTNNVGAFVAEHAKALSASIGVREDELLASESAPDEVLVPKFAARLLSLRESRRAHDDERGQSIAADAGERLAHTARFEDDRIIVDADILLRDLLADRAILYVRFVRPDVFDVAVLRRTLVESARVQRIYIDVAAYVDAEGVHVRWKGGRAGYNWTPRVIPPPYHALVQTVRLAPPVAAARERRRVPTLLGDILAELGWPA